MPTDTIRWIEIDQKVLDTINDNRSIIGSTEDEHGDGGTSDAEGEGYKCLCFFLRWNEKSGARALLL